MNDVTAKNREGIERYRKKIFKAKEEYRAELSRLPFEKKIEILVKLQKRAECIKKFV